MNIDLFVRPIADENSCGEFLKLDKKAYRLVRNSYNNALSSFRALIELPENIDDEELISNNYRAWEALAQNAEDVLINRTKDLEIFTWYCVSQVFSKDYLNNLYNCFYIINDWIKNYFDNLYPTVSEDKLIDKTDEQQQNLKNEYKLKPLIQFFGDSMDTCALYAPLQTKILVDDVTFGQFVQHETSNKLEVLKNKKINVTNLNEIQQEIIKIAEIKKIIMEISDLISSKVGCFFALPNFDNFIQIIDKYIYGYSFFLKDKLIPWPLDKNLNNMTENSNKQQGETENQWDENNENNSSKNNNEDNLNKVNHFSANVKNRDDAFAKLKVIAEFFKKNEPHSPIPFLIERAIRWGYMDLPALMKELLINDDPKVITHVNLVTGMDNDLMISSDENNIDTLSTNTGSQKDSERYENREKESTHSVFG